MKNENESEKEWEYWCWYWKDGESVEAYVEYADGSYEYAVWPS